MRRKSRFPAAVATAVITLAVAVVGLFGYLGVKWWLTNRDLSTQKAALQQQLNSINNKNEDEKNKIKDAGSNESVEQQAREQLGWVKPDEYKIVEKGN